GREKSTARQMENLRHRISRGRFEKSLLPKPRPASSPSGLKKKITRHFLLLALLVAPGLLAAQVKVWQGTLTLPTYEEAAPDPNPAFDQLATSRFNYPYTLRTNLTNKRTDHKWRAIFLENEYLKCSVLPDLGGHLYT